MRKILFSDHEMEIERDRERKCMANSSIAFGFYFSLLSSTFRELTTQQKCYCYCLSVVGSLASASSRILSHSLRSSSISRQHRLPSSSNRSFFSAVRSIMPLLRRRIRSSSTTGRPTTPPYPQPSTSLLAGRARPRRSQAEPHLAFLPPCWTYGASALSIILW